MDPGPDGGGADAEVGGDLAEGGPGAAAIQAGASPGEEERRRAWPGAQPVAFGGVAAQRLGGGRVQRHQPGAVEFGLSDGDDAGVEVDVVAGQPDGLADAHAGRRDQPEDRLASGGPQRRAQRAGPPPGPAGIARAGTGGGGPGAPGGG